MVIKIIETPVIKVTFLDTFRRVHVLGTPAQAYDRDCLLPTVKLRGGSVIIWAALSWFSVRPNITPKGRIPEENGLVQSWFDEHENEVKQLPCPTQSSDLNIIEPLWPILERSIQDQYPPSASVQELSRGRGSRVV
ncbi:DDE_3 domain-containing protein [Trichonephila clavipes]|uniref:DDE_3 domain-containing protein n=1 Tax=Trichonephila clavipes TaxID=2585209 RepID=A0A8X6SY48_TRICX|nr:DDE_3 domain-containing protein [Trichonephila clavipes]